MAKRGQRLTSTSEVLELKRKVQSDLSQVEIVELTRTICFSSVIIILIKKKIIRTERREDQRLWEQWKHGEREWYEKEEVTQDHLKFPFSVNLIGLKRKMTKGYSQKKQYKRMAISSKRRGRSVIIRNICFVDAHFTMINEYRH